MKIKRIASALAFVACAAVMPQALQAEEMEWYLVTDTNQKVPVADVDYLLAADAKTEFSVVLKDGDILSGVKSTTFKKEAAAGVEAVGAEGEGILLFPTAVESSMTLSGCVEGTVVRILSLQGEELKNFTAADGKMIVEVGDLPSGYYLLQAGQSTVKFIKK